MHDELEVLDEVMYDELDEVDELPYLYDEVLELELFEVQIIVMVELVELEQYDIIL